MTTAPIGVGIVGCGNIAGAYAEDIARYDHLHLIGAADLDPSRATVFGAEHNCRAYPTLEALLEDPAIDIVINLTIHHAHYDVTTQCLNARKHVHSEKPLALTYAESTRLVELAQQNGVRLGCSPFTFLGEAQQTTWQQIRTGRLGTIRVVYAEVNWGRIESWHPAPAPFYDVGVLWDVGVYPLSIITAIMGPARRVWSYGKVLHPDRVTKEGVPFHITTPDFVLTMLELADGTVIRLTTDFYVKTSQQNSGIEFHGDEGSLHMSSWHHFNSAVAYAPFGEPFTNVPLIQPGESGVRWGRGVADMAHALTDDRPHRATGEHAAHIVEILEAASTSMQTGQAVDIQSTFAAPEPMEWAR
ncbi:MAG: Gfo/Idh/MocA family oxidoreductase [Chloroflexota bacterium]